MTNSKTGTILLNVSSALGLAGLLLLATGSSKGGASGASDADNSSTTATSDPTEPKVSVCGKPVPNYEYIRGTCVNAKKGQCDEYYGLIPKFAPDMCKDEGGTFQTSTPTPAPCPKANLIGTCHYAQSAAGEPGQFVNYYSNNAESAAALKKECTEVSTSKTEWTDPPAAPAASASGAPAHPATKPATPAAPAKPATSAKPAPAASKK